MKSKIGIFVIGLVITSMLLTTLPVKITQAGGTFPCDAGGPYIGIADVWEYSYIETAPVYFDSTSSPPPGKVTYSWDFDDGEYGSGPDPVHEYTTPGDYDARIDVRTGDWSGWDTADVTIYTNYWELNCNLWANRIIMLASGYIKFSVIVSSTDGMNFEDSPPFIIRLVIWNGVYYNPIKEWNYSTLSPGHSTGWLDYSWSPGEAGEYVCYAKVIFPTIQEPELCESDSWAFTAIEL